MTASFTRRSLLSLAGIAGVGLAVAACSSDNGADGGADGGKGGASRSTGSTPSAKPKATGLTPAQVPLAGGVTVTVAGTGLAAVRGVTVGGIAARDVKATATKVTFTAPHQAMYTAGSADVALFDAELTPVASANQSSDGNGSAANDGQSGATQDSATGTPTASAAPVPSASSALATTSLSYAALTDVDRQLAYAMRYWKDYNLAEYGTMNPIGGDCANYVSQTLIARGWEQRDDWYSRSAGAAHSATWTYCPSMDPWLSANAATFGLTRRSSDERDKVQVGDIVFFDWNDNDSPDHTTIVSEVFTESDGTIRIKSASHNQDGPYRDLDEMITVQHPGGKAWFHTFDA
ncbi:IPT/TIG domain-containing protein [Curtobacterium sp. PhB130]|uniref:amidase domain-containing protein n=1 Tax=unclassified Curtobacterium TaxID=257496 RepID=UPI000F4C3686|nr:MULTISPECIES: amidase domain-containing protein [unclassified Curtobacterium]ROP58765.1 IPT/TIG domain-containing protein [Curtobacterium sp. ZW137]ROS77286.1 IPT/TIG domain-containing protein [Curtobacterium sp. PhB130]TCK66509.1 IPT/TIG domain-containing protein [Curtobacterium sp. PhB136]